MSSRPQRKNAMPKKNTAVAKTKSGQRGRPRKKTEEASPSKSPSTTPPPIFPELCSTKKKETPLQKKLKNLVQKVGQAEYYPDKLKRVVKKKTFLKAKPNFIVVGETNKRKLTAPQRQVKRQRSPSPELSMAAMVRMIEEKNELSDEDFMEILTCASPVWWEDPPHPLYIEEPISRRVPSSTSTTTSSNNLESHSRTSIAKISSSQSSSMDFEGAIEEFKKISAPKKSGKFVKKQQKLESVLGNIKTVKNSIKEIKSIPMDKNRFRNFSNSTDGDLSDLSFNEEEVLKNLESMEIPIEQVEIEIEGIGKSTNSTEIGESSTRPTVIIPHILPPLTRKPISIENKMKSDNSDSNYEYFENISHSNFRFISDDDISLVDTSENTDKILSVGSINVRTDLLVNSDICEKKNVTPKKVNDTEYITVYKIMSNDDPKDSRSKTENININKIENVNGKLNSFFKKCKNNKRIKQCESPAIPVTAVSDLKSKNGVVSSVVTDENRLNYECQEQIKNGTNNISCIREKVSIFKCSRCNYHAASKEVYTNHLSSCKVMVSMPWNRSYLMNQT